MGISACETVDKLEFFKKETPRLALNLESPPPIRLNDVKWIVITESNYAEIFDELKKQNKDPVLFALTDDEYKILSLNIGEVRKYIILNNDVLKKYREYYESTNDEQ